MAPNKSKRGAEDSPEERRSKRKKPNDEDEEEEKEREPISKGKSSSSKKTPAFSGGSSHKPAELFRKDLISAMKLADSEPLSAEDYLLIADSWRQEWERGVQVPVNEISLKSVELREVCEKNKSPGDFKIPKKHLHESKDDTYQLGAHELTGMQQLSEQIVRYDLDDLDVSWLRQLNEQREEVGEELIHEWTMERVIEALENKCHENMEIRKKTEEGLGIEYDEDIVCEICHSPDSEDSNEMVFCDGCDICVHQACYGIQTVPEGSWLCRTCALGIKPACILCPKAGGAMKSTRSGTKWAHVSCAIWIPEVTIGCVDKMEPITKISQIPASRWSLICVICKERSGACIQCSVKACKTAFHVTCAFTEKLEMKTVLIEDKNNEDVKLKAYCPKHSKKRDRNNSESESDSPRKSNSGTPLKDRIHEMSEEEKATLRADRLRKLEEEFYLLIKIPDIGKQLDLREEIIHLIFIFWKLKRKSLYNRPLLTPKTEEADLLEKQQEDSLVARMKMFVHLRQDLERVRNLSYMIGKREKIKRQFNRSRESVFYATLEVLTDKKLTLTAKEVDKIVNQYRDLPAPYSKDAYYGKEVKKGKSLSSLVKSESRKSIEKDSDTLSVYSTQSIKSKIGPSGRGIKNIMHKQKVKQSVSETPKSRRSRHKSDQADVKLNLKTEMATDVKNIDIEENDMAQNDVNNSVMETSVFPDVGKEDETIVNTSQTSSTDTITLTQSESESLKSPPPSQKGKKLSRNRNSVGKLEKNSKNLSDKQIERTTENIDIDLEKVENAKRGRKSRSQSTQRESASVETINKSEINISDDTIPVPEEIMTLSEKPTQRERRQSAAVKLSEDEKTELVTEFPSAKNVSDHIKAELNGYLKNNKLIVSNKLRRKVQNSLLSGKRRNRLSNGIIIDHSQKKIDSFLIKSPPQCDSSYKSPAKNVSRVLNELSPTRDRFEANNIERTASLRGSIKMSDFQIQRKSGNTPTRCSPLSHVTDRSKSVEGESVTDESAEFRNSSKKYDGSVISVRENLFDSEKKRLTRASRESTPDSCTSSVKSFSSYKRDRRRSDVEHVRTRSNTPVLGGKDYDDNETDLENFCEETKRRRTRSQHVDEMIACDGSASPSGLRRSHIENVGS